MGDANYWSGSAAFTTGINRTATPAFIAPGRNVSHRRHEAAQRPGPVGDLRHDDGCRPDSCAPSAPKVGVASRSTRSASITPFGRRRPSPCPMAGRVAHSVRCQPIRCRSARRGCRSRDALTFTYTPASTTPTTLSAAASGSGLSTGTLSIIPAVPDATAYTISGPTSAVVGAPFVLTFTANGPNPLGILFDLTASGTTATFLPKSARNGCRGHHSAPYRDPN